MPRIRTIKPDFFGSNDIEALPRFTARETFKAIWCYADDEGRMRYDDPRILKGQAWPLADWHTAADVAEDVACLVEHGLLIHYVVTEGSLTLPGVLSERHYLQVTNWHHQKINRAAESKLPAVAEGRRVPLTCTKYNTISTYERPDPPDSVNPHAQLTEDSPQEVEVEVEVEVESEVLRTSGDAGASPPPPDEAGALFAVEAALPEVVVDPQDEEKPITAQSVVGAWVDAMKANGTIPTQAMCKQVGRIAKELLNLGNDPERVLTAAEAAGQRGFATIDRELAVMNGRHTPITGVNGVTKPSHTDARVAAGLSAIEKLRRQEDAEAAAAADQTPREITQ